MSSTAPTEIAGVRLEDDEQLTQLLHTVISKDTPIRRQDGTSLVPADDLVGAVAEQLGLDPATVTEDERASIVAFIRWVEQG